MKCILNCQPSISWTFTSSRSDAIKTRSCTASQPSNNQNTTFKLIRKKIKLYCRLKSPSKESQPTDRLELEFLILILRVNDVFQLGIQQSLRFSLGCNVLCIYTWSLLRHIWSNVSLFVIINKNYIENVNINCPIILSSQPYLLLFQTTN